MQQGRVQIVVLPIVIAALLAVLVPAAQAAPTTVTGGGENDYNYKLAAAPGTTNNLSVSLQPGSGGFFDYVFTDSAGLVTPLYLSCRAPDGSNAAEGVHQTLICGGPIVEPLADNALRIEMGDGDDVVNVAFRQDSGFNQVAQAIKGEDGNDTLSGSGPATGDTFVELDSRWRPRQRRPAQRQQSDSAGEGRDRPPLCQERSPEPDDQLRSGQQQERVRPGRQEEGPEGKELLAATSGGGSLLDSAP